MEKTEERIYYYSFIAAFALLSFCIHFNLPELFLCIILLYVPVKKNFRSNIIFGIMCCIYVLHLLGYKYDIYSSLANFL